MNGSNGNIRVVIPLTIRRRNGRPKVLPPETASDSLERYQAPHVLKSLGRAWAWRRKLESGGVATVHEIASAEGFSERYVSRLIRLAYMSPSVIEHIAVYQLPASASIKELINSSTVSWAIQNNIHVFQQDKHYPRNSTLQNTGP